MSLSNRLVAFVDTSPYAESVCDYSAWAAGRGGQTVELVHVLDQAAKPETNMSGTIGLGARSNLLEQLATLDAERAKVAQAQGRAVLEDAAYRIRRTAPALSTTESLRHGGIVDAVKSVGQDAALVVVGKRGDTRDVASGLIGTNVEAVIRASSGPVLVANRAFSTPEKFLIAYDGGTSVERAIDYIVTTGILNGMQGLLVSVGPKDDAIDQKMLSACSRLEAAGISATAQWRDGDQVEVSIAQSVADEDIDLLVMGAYGHSRIRSMVIGSTTTAMVQGCKVPVLMIR